MKKIKSFIYLPLAAVLALAACDRVDDEKRPFSNYVYIENASSSFQERVVLKPEDTFEVVRRLQISLVKPLDEDKEFTFKVDPSLVTPFNEKYRTNYSILPERYYTLESNKVEMLAGQVRSTEIAVTFHGAEDFPEDDIFLLPFTVDNSGGLNTLEGSQNYYYVVKKASLIYYAADMTRNYIAINGLSTGTSGPTVGNLNEVSMECLVRFSSFKPEEVDGTTVSTVMGTEGQLLLRIGDVGLEPNQLQVVTAGGTISDNTLLETNRWYHIAITYKNAVVSGGVTQEQGEIKIYIDGELVSSAGFANNAPVNLRSLPSWAEIGGFHIGSSWDKNRWMFGDICEVRLWEVTRGIDEIQENMFELDPETPGLLGYWKFDEGEGNVVYDHSPNGRDGNSLNDISWIDVELPDDYYAQE
ncbi:MAG: DUF1735 and LamG domain-containing protein [Rikenellaceae bacterium]|nr:DUF1735 and LamG domain-containing protein [Rikenellaceae bacterium]